MDTVNNSEKWFAENALMVKKCLMAAEGLAHEFVAAADSVLRHDQAAILRSLKARVMAEVKDAQWREGSASLAFTESNLGWGLAAFPAGLLLGAAAGHKDPLATAAKMADSILGKSAPFGSVLVGVGKHGIPDDVKVIPLSRLARESKMSESQVRATLSSSGCCLTAPQTFAAAVDEIERRILDGAVSLPLSVEGFSGLCPPTLLITVVRAGKSHAEHPGPPPPSA